MKDVAVGAFGVATGGVTLLLKWSLLAQMQWWWPLVATVTARTAITLPMRLYPAARAVGIGQAARRGWRPLAPLLSMGTLAFPGGLLAFALGLTLSLCTAAFCARRLGGGLSSDTYGACIEVAEPGTLLGLAAHLLTWPHA